MTLMWHKEIMSACSFHCLENCVEYHEGSSSVSFESGFQRNKSESCFHVLENRVESHEGLSPDSFLVKENKKEYPISKVIYLLNLISTIFVVKEMSASCFHSFENCVESRKGL